MMAGRSAADVKCTWYLLLDKSPDKLRLNPRKTAYENLTDVTTNGDYEVTFKLKRPQPAFPVLLAGGFSVIYPCHMTATQMRQNPIGTGPFKFVEFKPNEGIKVTAEPGLLEEGPAVSRRDRIHHHPRNLDCRPDVCFRDVRYDIPV
jgi:peptide/nickel transport system substrate-binding protein